MKKQICFLLFIGITMLTVAQSNLIFPGLTEVQKQKLLNTKIAVPLPAWVPEGVTVIDIAAKTGKTIKLENKELAITYGKKLSTGISMKFTIDAGFEGLGDLPYEGEDVKSKLGIIYLCYEPFDEDQNGKKVKQKGFAITEWFSVNKLAFHVNFSPGNMDGNVKSLIPIISKADAKKILQSMQVLK